MLDTDYTIKCSCCGVIFKGPKPLYKVQSREVSKVVLLHGSLIVVVKVSYVTPYHQNEAYMSHWKLLRSWQSKVKQPKSEEKKILE